MAPKSIRHRVDQDEEQATFYNPRFEIEVYEVFYLPALTVPVGDTRKTGFLYPAFLTAQSDGLKQRFRLLELSAKLRDLETTFKYMQERGTQQQ
ncbi:hypothetical protein O9992_11280 [Vibrio lentus]|nr:hypothetical protein [Vibrio lentus]